ncbi:MAG: RNA polymerase sigma factor [Candidatus Doudnabacteria bacterium]
MNILKEPTQNPTDEHLVENYLNGDSHALDLLIQKYLSQTYNFVFKYVHTTQDAEDVTQEAFVKAWKKIDTFKRQYKFKTWLFTIAKNTALDHLKKRGLVPFSALNGENEGEAFEQSLVSYETLPDEALAKIQDAKIIGHAVDKLPDIYRQVITLYYDDQLNFREIAGLLKQSINTIKTRHRRALAYLRRDLPKN